MEHIQIDIPSVPRPCEETTEALNTSQMVGGVNTKYIRDDSYKIEIGSGSNRPFSIHAQRHQCFIYRVPKRLRDANPEAYKPQMVSIGPLHHFNGELNMKKCKERYRNEFCERTGKTLTELKQEIKKNGKKIRNCYEEGIFEAFTYDSFVEMISLDSVFAIELLLRYYHRKSLGNKELKSDGIIGKPFLRTSILRDLILLENQLPYFILDRLYNFAIPANTPEYPSFFTITYHYASGLAFPSDFRRGENPKCRETRQQHFESWFEKNKEPKHFTDMVRTLQCYDMKMPPNGDGDDLILYTATKLNEAGVMFEASSEEWPRGLEFQRGVLTLPRLELQRKTELVLRNVMALEQCYYTNSTFICSYIAVLNYLVDTNSDVELLIEKGIISHILCGNEEVKQLLNNLGKEIDFNKKYFKVIAKDLNDHYENYWNRTAGKLKHVYFGDLWKGTGTIAAIVLLVLTFLQTYKAF